MGTSTRNVGQTGHSPLIPTWLPEEGEPTTAIPVNNVEQEAPLESTIQPQSFIAPIPPNADSLRFSGVKRSITRYITDGGRDSGVLKRGLSRYVKKALGGNANATKRLGAASNSTAAFYDVLSVLSGDGGVHAVALHFSIDKLEGLQASEFFIKIADSICPDGGTNNEGIARSAYFDVIADNPEIMDKKIENLDTEEIEIILQKYITKVIMQKLLNDVANKIIRIPENIDEVTRLEEQIEQLIEQNVADSFAQVKQQYGNITDAKTKDITDTVYRRTYATLERAGA